MLHKYWRNFPWMIQLVQFIILIAVMASFFSFIIGPFVANLNGISLADIQNLNAKSSIKTINGGLIIQFFSALGIFLLPALFFAYFVHPRPSHYLGFRQPGKPVFWVLPTIIILSAAPLLTAVADWMTHFDLGPSFKETQAQNDRLMSAFLSLKNPLQLLVTFLVLALMPGFSEELFFRGIIMRFAARNTYKKWFPIVVSALLFALMHSNVYGLLSIFTAGILLGCFYYWTGSIWPGIIAHMVFNGAQITLAYVASIDGKTNAALDNSVPWTWIAVATPIAILGLWYLWKNKTPLKAYWASDFDPEELIEGTE